jgi:hypothetical protein
MLKKILYYIIILFVLPVFLLYTGTFMTLATITYLMDLLGGYISVKLLLLGRWSKVL